MKAGVINIGDELLIGQTVNTNLTWLGKNLGDVGISIYKSTTILDEEDEIIAALDDYMQEADLIIITGGLGPTNDDITKETLTQYFETELVLNQQVLARIESYFSAMQKEMLPSNVQQAMLPKDALVIDNQHGTASGMWFERNGKVIISLPGVPYEMKALVIEEIIPRLKSSYGIKGKYHQTIMLQGIGESFLAEKIHDWEQRIYEDQLHLAYLPSTGLIKLRLTADKGIEDAAKINRYFKELEHRFPEYVYGYNEANIFNEVGKLFIARNLTLGTVESCTGGGIANAFIQFPGTSSFF
ncbi:damage-inducible protein CinA [Brumimicrobium salinarum]|uniref:CinA-like protein n=1 Tax=Brumimicrobium salinarum TaxID=2058658 RepID=A0A2I0R339_9FLAO|nr:molybdopterin-binding protein [Brumimicrobium salinarum]PKR80994.1 damage-inducible protein CinA [Brumimicrobium salinarum]